MKGDLITALDKLLRTAICEDVEQSFRIAMTEEDEPVLFDNPVPREKLQKLGIYMPQSFVRIDAETEALLMCLSKEAAV